MKAGKFFIIGPAVICLFLTFCSCGKIDNLPQLEVQVIDEAGSPVNGAYVALFETESEWSTRSNPLQVWRKTDAFGKVLFTDLKEIIYYVYVRYDGKDNSLDEISTVEALTLNRRTGLIIHVR